MSSIRWPLIAVVGLLALWFVVRPAQQLPDIVLVTFDTTRADRLGAYGYIRDTSPNFDRLASQSLLFERFVVPMATTLPSHTSLFTGVYPIEHGIDGNLDRRGLEEFLQHIPAPNLAYFAEHMRSVGYNTAAFISAAPVRSGTGVERGFAHFDDVREAKRNAAETTDAAIRWLDAQDSEAPILLWVHYFDPHVKQPRPPVPRVFPVDAAFESYLESHEHLSTRGTNRRKAIRTNDRYDDQIHFMDHHFGRLIDTLESREEWSRTFVVVAGDHGEGLNQHGHAGHGGLWHGQLRSPLLIRIPGASADRFPGIVSGVDVLPTLLGRLDIPDEDDWLAQVSGRDVIQSPRASSPVLSQASGADQTASPPFHRPDSHDGAYALTADRWKYIRSSSDATMLFDLNTDPLERRDRSADHPEQIAAFEAEFQRMHREQLARRETFGGGSMEKASRETVEALRALGYVDDPETR